MSVQISGSGVIAGVTSVKTVPASDMSYLPAGADAVATTVQAKLREWVSVKDFGAVGNGEANDTFAIQKAINYCRTNAKTLRFPDGSYKTTSALDWSGWIGISVIGGDPGSGSVGSGVCPVTIVATGITGVAHDFSGSCYGSVSGINFGLSGGEVTANVLLARIIDGAITYGSELTFTNCSFTPGTVCGVLGHMSEVLTFNDCRWQCTGVPGFVWTTRGGASPWNISSPFGHTFTNALTLTCLRIFGGEFIGDSTRCLVLDAHNFTGGDVLVSGTYMPIHGLNCHSIGIYGLMENVAIDSVRAEATNNSGTHGVVYLQPGSNSALRHARIHARESNGGTIISGTGNINATTIISENSINIDGNLTDVTYHSVNPLYLTATGNVTRFNAFCNGIGTLAVTGSYQINDGNGGWIVSRQALFGSGTKTWEASNVDGLYSCSYAGSKLLMQTTLFGGTQQSNAIQLWNAPNPSIGTLGIAGSVVTATFNGTGDYFVVRKLA